MAFRILSEEEVSLLDEEQRNSMKKNLEYTDKELLLLSKSRLMKRSVSRHMNLT